MLLICAIEIFLNTVYTIQPVINPVVQPVWQPCWTNSCSFNRLSNRVIQPVWQRVWQQVVSCKRGFRRNAQRLLHGEYWTWRTKLFSCK